MDVKHRVRELLDRLPDECSLEDVQYHLYVMQKLEGAHREEASDELISQGEVERRMSRWTDR